MKQHPPELFEKLSAYHYERILSEEDLSRVLLRKEVLFYHQVLEHAIDHFLQVLFAENKIYFPSRKRTTQYIDKFSKKPDHCYERLMEILKLSVVPETIADSVEQLKKLTQELKE